MSRTARIERTTKESDVFVDLNLDGTGSVEVDTGVPFYVALPHSTIDWTLDDGMRIPIEERSGDEGLKLSGRTAAGDVHQFEIAPDGCRAANPAFDVTPARLVTALITERGICAASREGLLQLYPGGQAAA